MQSPSGLVVIFALNFNPFNTFDFHSFQTLYLSCAALNPTLLFMTIIEYKDDINQNLICSICHQPFQEPNNDILSAHILSLLSPASFGE